jgi:hypothetical protein
LNGVAIGRTELACGIAVGIELLLLADLGEVGLAGGQRAARMTEEDVPLLVGHDEVAELRAEPLQ